MESKDVIDELIDGLYESRKELANWKKEEEYFRANLLYIMKRNNLTQLVGSTKTCTLSQRSKTQISKEIPIEIIAPFQIVKTYDTLSISRSQSF